MPAGLSTGAYIRFCIVATLTAFAGSQVVHMQYRPLDDMEKLVEEEIKRRRDQIK
ncbi:ubiquinol-cytochrome c reductase complex assembly factor 6 sloth 2 [Cotesia typhae]|uniref:ubiquinol-cytochrome c reductase complex assembly factor 6 sloth 2 n=1 Tax=Cotesia typhae TaxID=2053667 RepID=UPI003D69AEAF